MHTKSKTPKSPRTVKAGSVTVKIYYSHSYKYPTFTVTWRIGLQRHRKTFSNEERAISFAQETAENLSKGHVVATTVTVAEAAILREAERLLAGSVPVHVAVSEYVTALRRLNGHGSLLEAVDHFVRFVARRETVRTVAEVVEDFIAAKSEDGLSGVYVNDLTWRLRRFAEEFGNIGKKVTNALRHSFASYRVAMTLDVPSVALELGNSPQKVFSNSRKVVTRSQAEAWFAVRPANGCTDVQES